MDTKQKLVAAGMFLVFLCAFTILSFQESHLLSTLHKIKSPSFFIPPDLLIDDNWYGIYTSGRYLGYSHSLMQAQEITQGGGYLLKNTTALQIPILGIMKRITLESNLALSKNYSIDSADINFASPGYKLNARLLRKNRNRYELRMKTPAESTSKEIELSEQFINSSFTPVFIQYLPPHKQITFSFFDPLLGRSTTLHITNQGTSSLTLHGTRQDVIEYLLDVEGVEGKLFTDLKGKLLRQDFLGFTLLKEEPTDLFSKNTQPTGDEIISRFTIPAKIIPNKEAVRYMKAKIEQRVPEPIPSDFNQIFSSEFHTIEVFSFTPPADAVMPVPTESLLPYLKEDRFIKFKGTDIERISRSLAYNENNPYVILKRIHQWVNSNIKKVPTVSIPNSLDVFRLKQGDCGELSALMTALLRSSGIPAYVNIGLVYQDGRFFYHAWVSAFIGGWIDTDPALNQIVADATHIKLKKGLQGQFDLFRFIDSIRISVLAYSEAIPDTAILEKRSSYDQDKGSL